MTDAGRFNQGLLVLARESRGLSQSELARQLGISQGTLSKLEAGIGEIPISEELLTKLSEKLRYPKSFFFRTDSVYSFGASFFYHRKRQTLPARDLRRIHAEINRRRMWIADFLKVAETTSEQQFLHMDVDDYHGDVELVAQLLRESWHLPPGPVQNLVRVVEDAGGIVVQCDLGARKLDAISLWLPGLPPLFFLNEGVPGDRLRFSLAHELGHIIMHRLPNPEMEQEADLFAGAFLMPAHEVKPHLTKLSLARLASLKPYWRVSMQALLMRADHLRLITSRQRSYLWTQLGAAGYRTREPAELDVPCEKATLIDEMITAFRQELGYGIKELAAMVNLFEDEFREVFLRAKQGHLRVLPGGA